MSRQTNDHPLRRWRKKEGLTLDAAASSVGTVRQVWYDWETGRRRPSAHYMPRLRDFTKGAITADHFFPAVDQAA